MVLRNYWGFLAVIFVFFGSSITTAQPHVELVTGNYLEDGLISVAGEGFGNGATIISWDDFDTFPDLTLIEGATPPIGPTWDSPWGGSFAPRVSSLRSISGNNSAKVCWNDGTTSNWASYFGWTGQGPYTSLYVSFWRYLDGAGGAWDSGSINHKSMYLFGTESDHPQITIGATMNGGTWYETTNGGVGFIAPNDLSGGSYLINHSTFNWNSTKSVWQRWEVYAEINEPYSSSNDIFQAFHNCRLIADESSVRLAASGAYDDFRLGHMDNSHATYDFLSAYYDDIYIATNRARVEIGDHPDFYSCTKRDIQVFESWNDGLITFYLRAPSFEDGGDRYLFIIDHNGNVQSPGYPLVESSTPGPPQQAEFLE